MTKGSFGRLTRLKVIFNALAGERFVRRSLLREFIDLAAEVPGLEEASTSATILLRSVEAGIDGREFEQGVLSIGAALAILENVTPCSEGARSIPQLDIAGDPSTARAG